MQRFISKIHAGPNLHIDDWCILRCFLGSTASMFLNIYGNVPNGLGRDVWTLQPRQITDFATFFFVETSLYLFQVVTIKMSFVFFYIRIFPSATVRKILHGTLVVTLLFGLAFLIQTLAACQPISYFWNRWDGEHQGHCLDINAGILAHASINIALSIWILAIPLHQIKGLQLPIRKKIEAFLMFSVGILDIVVSILRLSELIEHPADSYNATWEVTQSSKWSIIECHVGIICACMPSLRLFLVRCVPGVWSTTQSLTSSRDRQSKSRTRPLGSQTTLVAGKGQQPIELQRVTMERTFAVEYSDNDESSLVHDHSLDRHIMLEKRDS